jgi:hypothetical protein
MATIAEDYCSFELSKLLKEKGFDASKIDAYFPFVYYSNGKMDFYDDDKPLFVCEAVTQAMAMEWLRKVYGIFITIEIKGDPRKEDFIYYKWSVAKFNGNQITRIDNGLHTPEDYWVAEYDEGEDYNKSCETAIKYCLEHLI